MGDNNFAVELDFRYPPIAVALVGDRDDRAEVERDKVSSTKSNVKRGEGVTAVNCCCC